MVVARVKKIINTDEDIGQCSTSAAFMITIATEMFIQYLAEQTFAVVKTERKPRRNVQYKDVANAVARIDNLEFLADVVPRTIPFKKLKEQRAREAREQEELENGQATLDKSGMVEHGDARNGSSRQQDDFEPELMDVDRKIVDPIRDLNAVDSNDASARQLEMEMRNSRNGAH